MCIEGKKSSPATSIAMRKPAAFQHVLELAKINGPVKAMGERGCAPVS